MLVDFSTEVKFHTNEQRSNLCRGDWVTLVEADLVELHLEMDHIGGCSAEVFRKQIIGKIRNMAFQELLKIQDGHAKVRYTFFEDLSGPQNYLCNCKF